METSAVFLRLLALFILLVLIVTPVGARKHEVANQNVPVNNDYNDGMPAFSKRAIVNGSSLKLQGISDFTLLKHACKNLSRFRLQKRVPPKISPGQKTSESKSDPRTPKKSALRLGSSRRTSSVSSGTSSGSGGRHSSPPSLDTATPKPPKKPESNVDPLGSPHELSAYGSARVEKPVEKTVKSSRDQQVAPSPIQQAMLDERDRLRMPPPTSRPRPQMPGKNAPDEVVAKKPRLDTAHTGSSPVTIDSRRTATSHPEMLRIDPAYGGRFNEIYAAAYNRGQSLRRKSQHSRPKGHPPL